jgi:hypothetical protein
MILGTCDAAKAAACNRTARSAIVIALLGRLGGLFRRSIDIVDSYYGIKQFSNALDDRPNRDAETAARYSNRHKWPIHLVAIALL